MKITTLLSYLILGVMFISMLVMGYFIFYPFKTIEIHSPFKVITKTVIAGEDMIYQGSYCKYDDSPSRVFRTITGPDFIPTQIIGSVARKGCHKVLIHLNIPKNTTPGIYFMDGKQVLEVNAFQTQTKLFETEKFEVVAK